MSNETETLMVEFKITWLSGISFSTFCVMLQLFMYILIPKIRKLDQMILTQMALARLLNTIIELMLLNEIYNMIHLTLAVYAQTDAVMICWMFVFTKNLYEKVVVVYSSQHWNFILLSVLIWTLTIPLGLMCPLFLYLEKFPAYYQAYAVIKFILLSINIIYFCRIFYVVIKSASINSDLSVIVKICVISFILLAISSVQVFVNDLFSYFSDLLSFQHDLVMYTFCTVNSFQVVAMTVIFMIVSKAALSNSLQRWFR